MIFQIETGLEMSVLGDIDLSCDISDRDRLGNECFGRY